MRLVLLIGSGASIPAGMLSTDKITSCVLSGKDPTGKKVSHHTGGTYYFGTPRFAHMGWPDECVPRIVEFLKLLMPEIKHYYAINPCHTVSYEDLYYVVEQIHDSGELREYDNPVVQPFIDRIFPSVKPLLRGKKHEAREQWKLHELADDTLKYIEDVVRLLLERRHNIEALGWIGEACRDERLSKVDVFTLNHDTLPGQYFSKHELPFTDGFGPPINNVRYWDPKLFECNPYKINLFKLHGSINWYRWRICDGDWSDESIGIPLRWLPGDITLSPDGRKQEAIEGRPKLLIGTYNKMLAYTSGIYVYLHYNLYHSLSEVNRLLVCGYGFGDRGVNTPIIEWIYSRPDHRLIVIHGAPETLKRNSAGAIRGKWDNWRKNEKLIIIPEWIENTSWEKTTHILFANE